MTNTKERHQQILAAAAEAIEVAGGIEAIDALAADERRLKLLELKISIAAETHCHIDTARRNVAKAMRQARYGVMQDRRGGARPNSGPDPLPEDQRRQRVSTRLGPGYKELAQAIAEIYDLPGWGHALERALDRMVEGDRSLKIKLTKMGVVFDRIRVSEPETLFDDSKNQSVVRLRGWEFSSDTTGTITLDDNGEG